MGNKDSETPPVDPVGSGRRQGERRQAQTPFAGDERRAGQRRSGGDRRTNPRDDGAD